MDILGDTSWYFENKFDIDNREFENQSCQI